MALSKEKKTEIINEFAKSKGDTGSAEVQVALLTTAINDLSQHLIKFPKDKHSRLGLYKKVGKRQKLLTYIRDNSEIEYQRLITKLNIRDKYKN